MFAFTLKNAAGETESWHIDLRNKGVVGKGLGEKPNGKTPVVLHREGESLTSGVLQQSPSRSPTPTLATSSSARPTPSGCSCRAS